LDPNHPTVTVIAEIGDGGIKAKKVAKLCPSIDILGVNSYGGLASLPTRLRVADWNKPYMVTEFGTNGTWEVGKTAWGAPLEPSSTEKGREYAARYASGIASQKEWCVGSYVFLWGEKVEGTPTWFGMFLPGTGEKLGTVDAMATAWRGSPPPHLVPQIVRVASSAASKEIAPGSRQTVALSATGSSPLSVRYEIRPEMTDHGNHEPGQKAGAAIAGIVPPEGAPGGEQAFTAPRATGAYRLYLTVRDKDGGAATANLPFFVK
ncbi:MAG: glycosyl hydrolase family 2, partial [Cytophagales bacterium]|nr:glycosyl hydrolase family 2 [Armatimonadota bacterium]